MGGGKQKGNISTPRFDVGVVAWLAESLRLVCVSRLWYKIPPQVWRARADGSGHVILVYSILIWRSRREGSFPLIREDHLYETNRTTVTPTLSLSQSDSPNQPLVSVSLLWQALLLAGVFDFAQLLKEWLTLLAHSSLLPHFPIFSPDGQG